MKKLTIPQIKKIFKRQDLDEYFCTELSELLDMFSETFKLNTKQRRDFFLTQVVAETGVLKDGTVRVRENLNYSEKTLKKLSRYFRNNPQLAKKYGRNKFHRANKKMIANIWYADKNRSKRLRLGNIKKGDGWLYRGAGIFQTTGRENMTKDLKHIEKMTGITLFDENGNVFNGALSTYTVSILLGMAHWHRKNMWKMDSINEVTNAINLGLPKKKKIVRKMDYDRVTYLS